MADLISTRIQADTLAFDEVQATISKSPGLMKTAVNRRIRIVKQQIKAELAAPDDLPKLPFVWSYDPEAQKRARAYYFAVIVPKGSRGGRYERTGKLEAAWDVFFEDDAQGGAIVLENPNPEANFVWGERQVPSHYLTGWNPIDDIVEKYGNVLNLDLIEDWHTISDPYAGVT